jgi:uncharacterized cupin superfamily protein
MAERRWLKANLGDVEGIEHPRAGKAYLFGETRPNERYEDVGINVRVLEPGQPASVYHADAVEEFFLVLGGECLAIIEDEEVPLRKWDFLHTPPGVAHVIVGAGDGPAIVLAVGKRPEEERLRYPKSELAARYGASAEEDTPHPEEAYAPFNRPELGRPDYWDLLPWS